MTFFQNSTYLSLIVVPILNSSVLPALNLFTDKRIYRISIQNEEIISLTPIRHRILLLYDNSVVLPWSWNLLRILTCGNLLMWLEKIIFKNLYSYPMFNDLITKNESGFSPGDSTINQLLFLVNEIHGAFEDPKWIEVRTVFLDISKAFDKVWHDGLIFK